MPEISTCLYRRSEYDNPSSQPSKKKPADVDFSAYFDEDKLNSLFNECEDKLFEKVSLEDFKNIICVKTSKAMLHPLSRKQAKIHFIFYVLSSLVPEEFRALWLKEIQGSVEESNHFRWKDFSNSQQSCKRYSNNREWIENILMIFGGSLNVEGEDVTIVLPKPRR